MGVKGLHHGVNGPHNIIIIIHEFHRDASLETKLQGRYVSRITLQL